MRYGKSRALFFFIQSIIDCPFPLVNKTRVYFQGLSVMLPGRVNIVFFSRHFCVFLVSDSSYRHSYKERPFKSSDSYTSMVEIKRKVEDSTLQVP